VSVAQTIVIALALYGFLTIGFSFVAWMNSAAWNDEQSKDISLSNCWKWGVAVVLLTVFVVFIAGPVKP